MNGKELPVGRKYLPNLKMAFQTPENVNALHCCLLQNTIVVSVNNI